MGLSAYFTWAAPALAWTALGDANRGALFLAICRGEHSRKARCDDPPEQRAFSVLVSDTAGAVDSLGCLPSGV
jgi:hypothetical protein